MLKLPIVSRKGAEATTARLKEQYGIDLLRIEEDNKAFKAEYGKALTQYKASFTNYIASRVNFAQFQYQDYTLARLVSELYRREGLVAACVAKYQVHYPEPYKKFFRGKKEITDTNDEFVHLVRNPNPWMSETDYDNYLITYQLWTGNCYDLMIRDDGGRVIEFFPFSGLNISPIPSIDKFVDHYGFRTAEGITSEINATDIIHRPWPAIHPDKPFEAMSPMMLCARDIQTCILLGEQVANYAKNITIPGLVAKLTGKNAEDVYEVGEETVEDIKKEVRERFGGAGSGDIAVGEGGWDFDFLGFPLKDLDVNAAYKVPQTNICANFLIDPEFVKAAAGMETSTYDNQQTSKLNFFEGVLTGMWGRNSNKLSMGCQREFGEDVSCVYDINSVGIIRAQHEKRLNVAMPWIEKYQENYFNYLFPREACINAVKAMVANLNDSEVEGLFPPLPPKPEPLSTLKVKTEGVIAE